MISANSDVQITPVLEYTSRTNLTLLLLFRRLFCPLNELIISTKNAGGEYILHNSMWKERPNELPILIDKRIEKRLRHVQMGEVPVPI